MSLHEKMPLAELPRERLLRDGEAALSVQELVAILLGTGTQGKSVLILAQELLLHFGGVEGLLSAHIEDLMQVKGIGRAKAIVLKAAFSIAKRAAKEQRAPQTKLVTIAEVVALAQGEIGHLQKESLFIILRDVKCQLIHHEIIGMGTLSEVLVHPREVFQSAIRHGAYSIIVCHNHPSGDPTPSDADILLTQRLKECARILGIAFTDHLIVCKNAYTSMRAVGLFVDQKS